MTSSNNSSGRFPPEDTVVVRKYDSITAQEAWKALRSSSSTSNTSGCGNDATDNNDNNRHPNTTLSFVLFYASWNGLQKCEGRRVDRLVHHVHTLLTRRMQGLAATTTTTSTTTTAALYVIRVDASDESLRLCADDPNGFQCPSSLPALVLFRQHHKDNGNVVDIEIVGDSTTAVRSHHLMALRKNDDDDVVLGGGVGLAVSKGIDTLLQTKEQSKNSITVTSTKEEPTTTNNPTTSALANTNVVPSATPPDDSVDNNNNNNDNNSACVRIFVSGDRSQVGKSSVCMGLLGALLRRGYLPSELAYIKPATQCEATQLVATFCRTHGISAVPIGPIVYHAGFTRQFLAGATPDSSQLLRRAQAAVDELCNSSSGDTRKKVVVIDGVGYPAVGSICGTCNASVARACGYVQRGNNNNDNNEEDRIPVPVLLVGKSGVGDAVDSYNLNSAYFQRRNVTVLGAVFNRLPPDGYYSLENCQAAVTQYFTKYKPHERAFGFVPELPAIAKSRDDDNNNDNDDSSSLLNAAEDFVRVFAQHVDVAAIVKEAERIRDGADTKQPHRATTTTTTTRRVPSTTTTTYSVLTREQIEKAAKKDGALGG